MRRVVVTMSDLDLDALAALARAATPGPWSVVNDCVMATTEVCAHGSSLTEVIADEVALRINLAHIAAFDPPTTLALIERARRVEAERDRLAATIERVRRLAAGQAEMSERQPDEEAVGCGCGVDFPGVREALDHQHATGCGVRAKPDDGPGASGWVVVDGRGVVHVTVKRDDGSVGWVIVHHSLDGREGRE